MPKWTLINDENVLGEDLDWIEFISTANIGLINIIDVGKNLWVLTIHFNKHDGSFNEQLKLFELLANAAKVSSVGRGMDGEFLEYIDLKFSSPIKKADVYFIIDIISKYDETIDEEAKSQLKVEVERQLASRFASDQAALQESIQKTIVERKQKFDSTLNSQDLNIWLQSTNEFPQIWLDIGNRYKDNGKWREAIKAYEQVPNEETFQDIYRSANMECASIYFAHPEATSAIDGEIIGLDDDEEELDFKRLSKALAYAVNAGEVVLISKIFSAMSGEEKGIIETPLKTPITLQNVDVLIEMAKRLAVVHRQVKLIQPIGMAEEQEEKMHMEAPKAAHASSNNQSLFASRPLPSASAGSAVGIVYSAPSASSLGKHKLNVDKPEEESRKKLNLGNPSSSHSSNKK